MGTIMILFLLCTALTCLMMLLCYMISSKINTDREKNSAFECGFSPNKKTRLPFSLRFFLIAVIFLIFDVEIVLLLPIPMILSNSPISVVYLTLTMFLVILLLGLFYEWSKSMLEWAT